MIQTRGVHVYVEFLFDAVDEAQLVIEEFRRDLSISQSIEEYNFIAIGRFEKSYVVLGNGFLEVELLIQFIPPGHAGTMNERRSVILFFESRFPVRVLCCADWAHG